MTTLELSGCSFGVTTVTSAWGNPLAVALAATAFAAMVDPRSTVVSIAINSPRIALPSASYFCGGLVPDVCADTATTASAPTVARRTIVIKNSCSEDRQRVHRRSGSSFDRKRRERHQEF